MLNQKSIQILFEIYIEWMFKMKRHAMKSEQFIYVITFALRLLQYALFINSFPKFLLRFIGKVGFFSR